MKVARKGYISHEVFFIFYFAILKIENHLVKMQSNSVTTNNMQEMRHLISSMRLIRLPHVIPIHFKMLEEKCRFSRWDTFVFLSFGDVLYLSSFCVIHFSCGLSCELYEVYSGSKHVPYAYFGFRY